MAGRECYHCKRWIPEGEAHDCWTTTEAALTRDLSEDLRDAWLRIRETAAEFGEQRIYASHNSIMFSRRVCYCFVRPKRAYLELYIFLGRALKAPQVRKVHQTSRTKVAHYLRITHRDEVEAPITDWLREAYELGHERVTSTIAAPAPPPKNVGSRKRSASAKQARHASASKSGRQTKARMPTRAASKKPAGKA